MKKYQTIKKFQIRKIWYQKCLMGHFDFGTKSHVKQIKMIKFVFAVEEAVHDSQQRQGVHGGQVRAGGEGRHLDEEGQGAGGIQIEDLPQRKGRASHENQSPDQWQNQIGSNFRF